MLARRGSEVRGLIWRRDLFHSMIGYFTPVTVPSAGGALGALVSWLHCLYLFLEKNKRPATTVLYVCFWRCSVAQNQRGASSGEASTPPYHGRRR